MIGCEIGNFFLQTVDLATIDILRDRERGVPRYNQFRRLLRLKPAKTIDDITTNKEHVASMKEIYGNDVEKVDFLIGCLAEEPRPPGFGFSETQFVLFLMMASRRIEADRCVPYNCQSIVFSIVLHLKSSFLYAGSFH